MFSFGASTRLPLLFGRISLNTTRQNVPSASVKTMEEKIGLPPRPKKPLTPYFRFMQKLRPELVASTPTISATDVVRTVAKKWANVDPKLKKSLEDEYKIDQVQYIQKRAQYDSKLTDDQRIEIKQKRSQIIEMREKRANRKKAKDLGRPKRPVSGFLKFLNEHSFKDNALGKMSYKEWHADKVEQWKSMNDDAKEKYNAGMSEEMERYKLEMTKWEEKMIRLGNIDVIRNDSLLVDHPQVEAPIRRKKKVE